jgi:hypothetical protein
MPAQQLELALPGCPGECTPQQVPRPPDSSLTFIAAAAAASAAAASASSCAALALPCTLFRYWLHAGLGGDAKVGGRGRQVGCERGPGELAGSKLFVLDGANKDRSWNARWQNMGCFWCLEGHARARPPAAPAGVAHSQLCAAAVVRQQQVVLGGGEARVASMAHRQLQRSVAGRKPWLAPLPGRPPCRRRSLPPLQPHTAGPAFCRGPRLAPPRRPRRQPRPRARTSSWLPFRPP